MNLKQRPTSRASFIRTKVLMKKTAAILIIVFLIVNLIVFALKLISGLLFWLIIAVLAFIAFKGFKTK